MGTTKYALLAILFAVGCTSNNPAASGDKGTPELKRVQFPKNQRRAAVTPAGRVCMETGFSCEDVWYPVHAFSGRRHERRAPVHRAVAGAGANHALLEMGNLLLPVSGENTIRAGVRDNELIILSGEKVVGLLPSSAKAIGRFPHLRSIDCSALSEAELKEALSLLKNRRGLYLTVAGEGHIRILRDAGLAIQGLKVMEPQRDLSLLSLRGLRVLSLMAGEQYTGSASLRSLEMLDLSSMKGAEYPLERLFSTIVAKASGLKKVRLSGKIDGAMLKIIAALPLLDLEIHEAFGSAPDLTLSTLGGLVSLRRFAYHRSSKRALDLKELQGLQGLHSLELATRGRVLFGTIPAGVVRLSLAGEYADPAPHLASLTSLRELSLESRKGVISLGSGSFMRPLRRLALIGVQPVDLSAATRLRVLSLTDFSGQIGKYPGLGSLSRLQELRVEHTGAVALALPRFKRVLKLSLRLTGEKSLPLSDSALSDLLAPGATYVELITPKGDPKAAAQLIRFSALSQLVVSGALASALLRSLSSFPSLEFFGAVDTDLSMAQVKMALNGKGHLPHFIYLSSVGGESLFLTAPASHRALLTRPLGPKG